MPTKQEMLNLEAQLREDHKRTVIELKLLHERESAIINSGKQLAYSYIEKLSKLFKQEYNKQFPKNKIIVNLHVEVNFFNDPDLDYHINESEIYPEYETPTIVIYSIDQILDIKNYEWSKELERNPLDVKKLIKFLDNFCESVGCRWKFELNSD